MRTNRRAPARGPVRPALAPMLGLFALAALALAAGATAQTKGPGVKVVVNAEGGETRISRDDVVRIYLGKKTLWGSGARVTPVMVDESSPTGEAFLEDTLHKSVSQYRAYWKRLLFSGGGAPPRTFRSSAQVVDFVAKQPGAIGVVEATVTDERVKVVQITD